MRFPRMTTRRWMVAVAMVALAFWGSLTVVRLKRQRAYCLARAAWHLAMEAQALHALSMTRARPSNPAHAPDAEPDTQLVWIIDRTMDLPAGGWSQLNVVDALSEGEAIAQAKADSRRRLMDVAWRRGLERPRKQVDHHAALARKYTYAASCPWNPMAPDPPEPN